jgi:hypothetical protein
MLRDNLTAERIVITTYQQQRFRAVVNQAVRE